MRIRPGMVKARSKRRLPYLEYHELLALAGIGLPRIFRKRKRLVHESAPQLNTQRVPV
jgi:hypothetical protein